MGSAPPFRILLIRTSALGDIVHALPVLATLRRAQPDATVAWVVEDSFAPLLSDHPDIDRLIVARTRAWRRRPLSKDTLFDVLRFRRELDDFGADVALDLMGNHKSAAIAAASMADRRVGFSWSARREPSSAVWLSETVEPKGTHAVDRGLSLLPALGLPVDRPASFDGDRLLPAARTSTSEAYAAILPGAGWENKRYPAEWWGEVAALLAEAGGPPARVFPGPGEEALAQETVAASRGHARLMPADGLAALAGSLRGAAIALGGDTGPIHLAHALGTPVLCLMGPTDPTRTGPYERPDSALWHRLPCSFCHQRLDEPKACLLELPPAEIARRALRILTGASSAS